MSHSVTIQCSYGFLSVTLLSFICHTFMKGVEKTMTVAELKEELADADDNMEVMVTSGSASRFQGANVEEMEIDIWQPDAGFREADIFTQGTHRKKVILIV